MANPGVDDPHECLVRSELGRIRSGAVNDAWVVALPSAIPERVAFMAAVKATYDVLADGGFVRLAHRLDAVERWVAHVARSS